MALPPKTGKSQTLSGFSRSPIEQAAENLQQALRVLELVPVSRSELTPHPLTILRAEIQNAQRYLRLVSEVINTTTREAA